MNKIFSIELLLLFGLLVGSMEVVAQTKSNAIDEIAIKLQVAENAMRKSAFHATVISNYKPKKKDRSRRNWPENLSIECDGKGNARWIDTFRERRREIVLVNESIFERINSDPWRDVTDEFDEQPSWLVWIRWRNYEDDPNFDYVVHLAPVFFERLKTLSSSRLDKIDGNMVEVFEANELEDARSDEEPKFIMKFWFRDDGKIQRIYTLIDGNAFGSESSDDYETTIDFQYPTNMEKIEAPF